MARTRMREEDEAPSFGSFISLQTHELRELSDRISRGECNVKKEREFS